jgi:hypothetical protein
MKVPPEVAGLAIVIAKDVVEAGEGLAGRVSQAAWQLLREESIERPPVAKLSGGRVAKAAEQAKVRKGAPEASQEDALTSLATSPNRVPEKTGPTERLKVELSSSEPAALPDFDKDGFLPDGIVDASMGQFIGKFVNMPRRQIEFQGMERALRQVANSWRGDGPPQVFVSGKWVTDYDPQGFTVNFSADHVDAAKLAEHDPVLAGAKADAQLRKYGGTILPFDGDVDSISTSLRRRDGKPPGIVRLDLSTLVGPDESQPVPARWISHRLKSWQAQESQRLQQDSNRMDPPAYRILLPNGEGPWASRWGWATVRPSLPKLMSDGSWQPGDWMKNDSYVSNTPVRWLDPMDERRLTYEVQIRNTALWSRYGQHRSQGSNLLATGGYRLLRRVSDQEIHDSFVKPTGMPLGFINGDLFSDLELK